MDTQNPLRLPQAAQLMLSTSDLNSDITFLEGLDFRLDQIFPADDPAVAILSGHGLQVRLERGADCAPAVIYLLTEEFEQLEKTQTEVIAPNGTIFRYQPRTPTYSRPITRHQFEVRQLRDSDPWVIGRAGMLYRDLLPGRLGGSIIASHIRIPIGGPVPDRVHYHTIGFQLIYCYRGWVKLVYEDQGPPFILNAGDCVIQPPEIRHRVLESSDNLEVIEIGVPAEHITSMDHNMELPNAQYRPDRVFQGQRFCHHRLADAKWEHGRMSAFDCRDTGILAATQGLASVQVMCANGTELASPAMQHDCEILFSFVLAGSFTLIALGYPPQQLNAGAAFVVPPMWVHRYSDISEDLELLEVSLPGSFSTI